MTNSDQKCLIYTIKYTTTLFVSFTISLFYLPVNPFMPDSLNISQISKEQDEHRQTFRDGSSRANPDVRVLVLGVQLPAGQGTVGIRCVF